MRLTSKLFFATLVGVALLYTSCKKEVTYGKQTVIVDQTGTAREIAMNLYSVLNTKLSGSQGLNFNINPTCGDVVTTPTNLTTNSGDTTSTLVGNSIFTYQCSGFFDNSPVSDAYTLADTLTINRTNSVFASYFSNTQDYIIKSLDSTYQQVSVGGDITTMARTSKFKNGMSYNPTEFHQLACQYTLHNITINRGSNGAQLIAGPVDFSCEEVDAANGAQTEYVGYILGLPDHILEINLRGTGIDKLFDLNTVTGEVTTVR